MLHSQQWYMKIVARLRVQQFSCTTGGSALIMALFLQSSLIFNSLFVLLFFLVGICILCSISSSSPLFYTTTDPKFISPFPLVPGVIVSVAVASPTLISNPRVTPLPHAERVREWSCGRGVSLSQQFFHHTVCHVQP